MTESHRSNGRFYIFFSAVILYCIGLMMIFSSSEINMIAQGLSPYHYVSKQLVFGGVSLFALLAIYLMPLKVIDRYGVFASGAILILMISTLIFGKAVNGNTNWIDLGFFSIQPSEFSKIAVIYLLATVLRQYNLNRSEILVAMGVIGFFAGLIVLQSDIGTASIVALCGGILVFVAGSPIVYLAGAGSAAILGIGALVKYSPNRMARFLIFMDPYSDPYRYGYQLIQSLSAIAEGGFWGKGLGNSILKRGYLPELHTDFIFSILVEEIGAIGSIVVIALFVVLVLKILEVAYMLRNKKHAMIVAGVGVFIGVEAMINLLVVMSAFPVMGISLPFVSYGGSGLLSKFIMLGLVLNINKNSEKIERKRVDDAIKVQVDSYGFERVQV